MQLIEDDEIDMDMENRPDMDIPIGLNATDFAASVPRSSSPKRDDNNASDASSDLMVGEYVPPAPVRQRTFGPQTCPGCGSLEKTQSQLIVHISQFHSNYVYPCRSCPKTFFTHNSRYKHETEHNPPNFYCGVCSQAFHFMGELNAHMPKHGDVKPFPCTVCPKGYYAKKSLTRHMELHNDKTYQCEHCPNSYESKDRLYVHKRGQHGRGYSALCGEHFKWPGRQHRHMKKCTTCGRYMDMKKALKFRKPFKKEPSDTVKKEL